MLFRRWRGGVGRFLGFRFELALGSTAVADEFTGRGEFTKMMPHHFFGNPHLDEDATVMYGKRISDHFRSNGRVARPRFDRGSVARLYPPYPFQDARMHIWSFLE